MRQVDGKRWFFHCRELRRRIRPITPLSAVRLGRVMDGRLARSCCASRRNAVVPAPSVATAQSLEPAMFVIHDADTTIYLFGTFHALDGDPRWLENGVRSAFEQSDELVLETLLPEGPMPRKKSARQLVLLRRRLPPPFHDHANGDQRQPFGGDAGRQWRGHGPSSHCRGRGKARPGPRNSATADEHVQSPARRRRATGESENGRAGA